MKTLTIKLTAPLQSYGNEATFNRRTSFHCPSKSAVIGMITAALGYRRQDCRISNLNQLKFAVRVDQPGKTLIDFQTVEYNSKKSRKVTYRNYLQDAVFVVAISGANEQIQKIDTALHHPKFQLFLGRRSNVPAGPLQTKLFSVENPMEVLKKVEWQAADWYQRRQRMKFFSTEILADASLAPERRNVLVKDKVGSFDQKHRYHSYRAVCSYRVKLKNKYYQEHDIMSYL